ncbi:unnamed protein product [Phaedon cochleariae]|uniref:Uncharacterized protein n=1 Tax=Phaedon cochleariae TaxID=80249 RepID=A0A9N9SGG1_PHACE|nr:unnamed protein product [Phaedon cochleariae]
MAQILAGTHGKISTRRCARREKSKVGKFFFFDGNFLFLAKVPRAVGYLANYKESPSSANRGVFIQDERETQKEVLDVVTRTDFKYLLKKRASIIQTDLSKTGGGPSETSPLSSFEKRALLIMGDSFYKGTGCPEVAVISNNAPRMEEVGRQPLDQPSSSSSVPTLRPEAHLEHDYSFQPPPKKRKGIIDEAYEETISVLKEIRNVVDSRLEQISNSIDKLAEVLKSK